MGKTPVPGICGGGGPVEDLSLGRYEVVSEPCSQPAALAGEHCAVADQWRFAGPARGGKSQRQRSRRAGQTDRRGNRDSLPLRYVRIQYREPGRIRGRVQTARTALSRVAMRRAVEHGIFSRAEKDWAV